MDCLHRHRLMHQNLNKNEELSQHPDYPVWYEQTLLKNQLAFEIKREYGLFERALELNHVSYMELERLALQHEYMLHVKEYLQHDKKRPYILRCRLAEKINTNIAKHFYFIKYFSEKEGLSTQAVIDKIKVDAKSDRIHGFSDEWERLKTIRSPAIERLLSAKLRLDKATTPQNITI